MKLSKILSILKFNKIHVGERDGKVFHTDQGSLYLYRSKYRFYEAKETNIPFFIYKKLPTNVSRLIVVYKDSLFLLNVDDIIKVPRLVGGKKVLPIHESSLIPLRIPPKSTRTGKFIHLHSHSEYSLLDSVSSCKAYVEKATSLGVESMAITDHGNMSGHMDFYLRCKASGIKPIFGIEAYFVDDATIKDSDHRSTNHIVLLAKNEEGYKNLLKLQKISWSDECFYYRPRIDWGMLKAYKGGLVCLTACLRGLIGVNLMANKPKKARKNAKKLHRIFGDDLYLELQLLNISDGEKDLQYIVNNGLISIAEELGLSTVITNDVHYVDKGMHELQDMVIKIHRDTELYSIKCKDLWFKTYDEMLEAYKKNCSYVPKRVFNLSIDATREIANKCNYEIPTGEAHFPKYDYVRHPVYMKWGRDINKHEFLEKLVRISAKRKGLWEKEGYKERIKYELDAFEKTNSVDYLLIVDDLLRNMRGLGCLFNMRGSANGSLVCHVLGFSVVDPIKYSIMFERFISPGRVLQGMQDIDIDLDFEAEYRDVAIDYLKKYYGEDHICSVCAFNRLQLRSSIKRLAKVEYNKINRVIDVTEDEHELLILKEKLQNFSYQSINKVTKEIHGEVADSLGSEEVQQWYDSNKEWYNRYVRPIIGNAYTAGIHPAGVVITPTPYDEWIPVRTQKDKAGNRVYTSQWENSHTYEEFLNERGVMILDILGVKTLSIISKTIADVNSRHGKRISLDNIPTDDPKVYETLSNGENLGYFQLGKPSLKGLLKELSPDRIEDLIFLSAADRPGALAAQAHIRYIKRKHGREKVTFPHKSLRSVLKDTYGVVVYSEHIMKTATEFAGMSIVEAEELRKIIKAKDPLLFSTINKICLIFIKSHWILSFYNLT